MKASIAKRRGNPWCAAINAAQSALPHHLRTGLPRSACEELMITVRLKPDTTDATVAARSNGPVVSGFSGTVVSNSPVPRRRPLGCSRRAAGGRM